MSTNACRCLAGIQVHHICAPGTRLPESDCVYLVVEMFNTLQRSQLRVPCFPLILGDAFVFQRMFLNEPCDEEFMRALRACSVGFDLRQSSKLNCGGKLLAYYDCNAFDLLFKNRCFCDRVNSSTQEIFLKRTLDFPGPPLRMKVTISVSFQKVGMRGQQKINEKYLCPTSDSPPKRSDLNRQMKGARSMQKCQCLYKSTFSSPGLVEGLLQRTNPKPCLVSPQKPTRGTRSLGAGCFCPIEAEWSASKLCGSARCGTPSRCSSADTVSKCKNLCRLAGRQEKELETVTCLLHKLWDLYHPTLEFPCPWNTYNPSSCAHCETPALTDLNAAASLLATAKARSESTWCKCEDCQIQTIGETFEMKDHVDSRTARTSVTLPKFSQSCRPYLPLISLPELVSTHRVVDDNQDETTKLSQPDGSLMTTLDYKSENSRSSGTFGISNTGLVDKPFSQTPLHSRVKLWKPDNVTNQIPHADSEHQKDCFPQSLEKFVPNETFLTNSYTCQSGHSNASDSLPPEKLEDLTETISRTNSYLSDRLSCESQVSMGKILQMKLENDREATKQSAEVNSSSEKTWRAVLRAPVLLPTEQYLTEPEEYSKALTTVTTIESTLKIREPVADYTQSYSDSDNHEPTVDTNVTSKELYNNLLDPFKSSDSIRKPGGNNERQSILSVNRDNTRGRTSVVVNTTFLEKGLVLPSKGENLFSVHSLSLSIISGFKYADAHNVPAGTNGSIIDQPPYAEPLSESKSDKILCDSPRDVVTELDQRDYLEEHQNTKSSSRNRKYSLESLSQCQKDQSFFKAISESADVNTVQSGKSCFENSGLPHSYLENEQTIDVENCGPELCCPDLVDHFSVCSSQPSTDQVSNQTPLLCVSTMSEQACLQSSSCSSNLDLQPVHVEPETPRKTPSSELVAQSRREQQASTSKKLLKHRRSKRPQDVSKTPRSGKNAPRKSTEHLVSQSQLCVVPPRDELQRKHHKAGTFVEVNPPERQQKASCDQINPKNSKDFKVVRQASATETKLKCQTTSKSTIPARQKTNRFRSIRHESMCLPRICPGVRKRPIPYVLEFLPWDVLSWDIVQGTFNRECAKPTGSVDGTSQGNPSLAIGYQVPESPPVSEKAGLQNRHEPRQEVLTSPNGQLIGSSQRSAAYQTIFPADSLQASELCLVFDVSRGASHRQKVEVQCDR